MNDHTTHEVSVIPELSLTHWYSFGQRFMQKGPRGREQISDQPSPRHDQAATESHARLRERLVVAVRAICPYWMVDRQEDLVQIAMMAVLRQQEKLDTDRPFPNAYLRRAAYTALVDEMRRLRTDREVPLDDDAEPRIPAATHEDPERRTLSREISAGVRACLAQLAPSRRTAVTLHLLAYKVPQIATRMAWSRKRAENLVYRGLDAVRRCLTKKGMRP
ncbi:MAG: RNA polymerase sigma factor [Acidobacteriota bacterium]